MIEFTTQWVKGEAFQGKIMLFIGMLLLIAFAMILRSNDTLMRGMMIPLALVTLICIGYGGNLIWSRQAKLKTLITEYQQSPQATIDAEKIRVSKEEKTYTMLKTYVWPLIIVMGLVVYFIMGSDYYKGLGIGISLLGLVGLILDTTLSRRAAIYFDQLQNL